MIFQRLNNAKKYPGTGIGLAICRKVVENHKGTINAFSNSGSGSTFDVYLPVDFKANIIKNSTTQGLNSV
jgi:signal transduction histidine kinase